jgi:hypothetical protein
MNSKRIAACEGKERFATAQLAHRIARRRQARKPGVMYRCKYCGGWHIGRGGSNR